MLHTLRSLDVLPHRTRDARAIGMLRGLSDTERTPTLEACLDDDEPWIRRCAVLAAASLDEHGLVARATTDPSRWIRRTAVPRFVRSTTPEALVQMWPSWDEELRTRAVAEIGREGNAALARALWSLGGHPLQRSAKLLPWCSRSTVEANLHLLLDATTGRRALAERHPELCLRLLEEDVRDDLGSARVWQSWLVAMRVLARSSPVALGELLLRTPSPSTCPSPVITIAAGVFARTPELEDALLASRWMNQVRGYQFSPWRRMSTRVLHAAAPWARCVDRIVPLLPPAERLAMALGGRDEAVTDLAFSMLEVLPTHDRIAHVRRMLAQPTSRHEEDLDALNALAGIDDREAMLRTLRDSESTVRRAAWERLLTTVRLDGGSLEDWADALEGVLRDQGSVLGTIWQQLARWPRAFDAAEVRWIASLANASTECSDLGTSGLWTILRVAAHILRQRDGLEVGTKLVRFGLDAGVRDPHHADVRPSRTVRAQVVQTLIPWVETRWSRGDHQPLRSLATWGGAIDCPPWDEVLIRGVTEKPDSADELLPVLLRPGRERARRVDQLLAKSPAIAHHPTMWRHLAAWRNDHMPSATRTEPGAFGRHAWTRARGMHRLPMAEQRSLAALLDAVVCDADVRAADRKAALEMRALLLPTRASTLAAMLDGQTPLLVKRGWQLLSVLDDRRGNTECSLRNGSADALRAVRGPIDATRLQSLAASRSAAVRREVVRLCTDDTAGRALIATIIDQDPQPQFWRARARVAWRNDDWETLEALSRSPSRVVAAAMFVPRHTVLRRHQARWADIVLAMADHPDERVRKEVAELLEQPAAWPASHRDRAARLLAAQIRQRTAPVPWDLYTTFFADHGRYDVVLEFLGDLARDPSPIAMEHLLGVIQGASHARDHIPLDALVAAVRPAGPAVVAQLRLHACTKEQALDANWVADVLESLPSRLSAYEVATSYAAQWRLAHASAQIRRGLIEGLLAGGVRCRDAVTACMFQQRTKVTWSPYEQEIVHRLREDPDPEIRRRARHVRLLRGAGRGFQRRAQRYRR